MPCPLGSKPECTVFDAGGAGSADVGTGGGEPAPEAGVGGGGATAEAGVEGCETAPDADTGGTNADRAEERYVLVECTAHFDAKRSVRLQNVQTIQTNSVIALDPRIGLREH